MRAKSRKEINEVRSSFRRIESRYVVHAVALLCKNKACTRATMDSLLRGSDVIKVLLAWDKLEPLIQALPAGPEYGEYPPDPGG